MQSPYRASLLAVLATTILAPGLVACGESGSDSEAMIDTRLAEEEIRRGYEAQLPGSEVESVDCPAEIDSATGTKAVCTMTMTDGTSGDIDIEVLNEEGHISWKPAGTPGASTSDPSKTGADG